jgi:hypothetical protein
MIFRASIFGTFLSLQLATPVLGIMAPAVPATLKPIQPFITKADEMKVADPVVSYYCMPEMI